MVVALCKIQLNGCLLFKLKYLNRENNCCKCRSVIVLTRKIDVFEINGWVAETEPLLRGGKGIQLLFCIRQIVI